MGKSVGKKEKKKGKKPPRGKQKVNPLQALIDQWFAQSPSLAVGLFCTLPLWLAYEWAQLHFGEVLPENGAEAAILNIFGAMGELGQILLRLSAGGLVLGAGVLLLKRKVSLFKVGGLVILEGLAWGSIIGPLGLFLAEAMPLGPMSFWPQGLFCSLGAGLYEEFLFRLFLVSLLVLIIRRALEFHDAPRLTGYLLAALISGFIFAMAHHFGPGMEPPSRWPIIFRTVMGMLLGLLFIFRGFGVVVYAHTWYDIIFFLNDA